MEGCVNCMKSGVMLCDNPYNANGFVPQYRPYWLGLGIWKINYHPHPNLSNIIYFDLFCRGGFQTYPRFLCMAQTEINHLANYHICSDNDWGIWLECQCLFDDSAHDILNWGLQV